MTKLWIDDERVPPVGWRMPFDWAQTSIHAINFLQNAKEWNHPYGVISFDHDLGYNYEDGSSRLDGGVRDDNSRGVLTWMIENDFWPTQAILVHTMNPVGAQWLLGTAKRYAPSHVSVMRGPIA